MLEGYEITVTFYSTPSYRHLRRDMGSILILRALNALDNVLHQMPELVTAEDLPGNTVKYCPLHHKDLKNPTLSSSLKFQQVMIS